MLDRREHVALTKIEQKIKLIQKEITKNIKQTVNKYRKN